LRIDVRHRFSAPPIEGHLFGTDQLGRDLLVRVLSGGRISLAIGFAAMLISTVFGTTIGVAAGYYGGLVNALLMRFVDAVLCFPQVFLLLVLAAFITPSIAMITLIIAATSWMEVARVVQSQIKALRERDFTLAAEMLGASGAYIMFNELLRNAIGPIIVAATLTVARAILAEAYVSFLGYGIQPPLASWGNMLNNAQQYLGSAPWLAIFPGLAITLAVASFNFIGDGLRDALDARMDVG
jgi:peptide/nickel transport system permease protein